MGRRRGRDDINTVLLCEIIKTNKNIASEKIVHSREMIVVQA